MVSLTKNVVFGKAGATITCPVCLKTAIYQIGQLDRDEWVIERGKYRCKRCRALPAPVPIFPRSLNTKEEDIDKLLEMI